jgi:hypothetical protein
MPRVAATVRQSEETGLAKGQNRGNREKKKPKADKNKPAASATPIPLLRRISK